MLSDGFSGLEEGLMFDVIASNLPTHISNEVLTELFEDTKKHLNSKGKIYVVTVSKLKVFIQKEFKRIFGNYTKIANDNMYTVSLAFNI